MDINYFASLTLSSIRYTQEEITSIIRTLPEYRKLFNIKISQINTNYVTEGRRFQRKLLAIQNELIDLWLVEQIKKIKIIINIKNSIVNEYFKNRYEPINLPFLSDIISFEKNKQSFQSYNLTTRKFYFKNARNYLNYRWIHFKGVYRYNQSQRDYIRKFKEIPMKTYHI
jgi:hypothetical protein